MPIVQNSSYKVPFWLYNNHTETLLPALLRKPKPLDYKRHRINTNDNDFLDLDYVINSNDRIVILSHGLEGNSDRYYMRGMAHKFINQNWDVLSWNCRSCSEEINLTPKLYHHGATEDLEVVINDVISRGYKKIILIGFSLGGSLVVKYLGEKGQFVPSEILAGVAFSIPCQLGSCANKLSDPDNKFYLNRFLNKLKAKIKLKAEQFPDIFDLEGIDEINGFYNFDTTYSAPLYGFKSVDEFYHYASAGNYIEGIKVPTLLVNSLNDPMFPDDCYPYKEAKNHKYFYLETPEKGGHLGYWWPGQKESWAEKRAYQFVSVVIGQIKYF
ncbi:MAG: alpha/beta fold hydrolase [Cyclobacteriaceae bacterium]|nr:alpha/beta fold hydrolase [Cyclobacteriaceae bacterium]